MIEVELIIGGTFQIDEMKIKKTYFGNNGIVIESENAPKITIKDSEENRIKWKPILNN